MNDECLYVFYQLNKLWICMAKNLSKWLHSLNWLVLGSLWCHTTVNQPENCQLSNLLINMNLPSNVVVINQESACGLFRIICRIFDFLVLLTAVLHTSLILQKCEKESSISSSRFLSRHLQIFSHQTYNWSNSITSWLVWSK